MTARLLARVALRPALGRPAARGPALRRALATTPLDDDAIDPWMWVAPARRQEAEAAPVDAGPPPAHPLSVDEITAILADRGGVEIATLALDRSVGGLCDFMVFASGKSPGHLRSIAGAVVAEARRRPGGAHTPRPASGESDWFSIDLDAVVVQLLSPGARAELALEAYWDPDRRDPVPS